MNKSHIRLYYENSLKNHLDEEFLFNSENMKSYSECDYAMNLWSSLLEKVFRKSGVIPH
jgi:hypothetical protein